MTKTRLLATLVLLLGSTAYAKSPVAKAPAPAATMGAAVVPTAALLPLPARPPGGTAVYANLPAAMTGKELPRWPIELRPFADLQRLCTPGPCSRLDRVELALVRAARWMATFDEGPTRFDAAVALHEIRETVDSDTLRTAFAAARQRADGDHDHPQRRFWIADFASEAKHTSRWAVPGEPGQRVNVNKVLHEALYCKEYGWRPATMAYVCGPMRDAGGYETTHGLWALAIAVENGCLKDADYIPCARALHAELAAAQPAELRPQVTLDVDLYAERLLQPLMTGFVDPAIERWVDALLAVQNPDGSWGIRREGEDPYYRYHATMMSAWSFSEWCRRQIAYPALRMP